MTNPSVVTPIDSGPLKLQTARELHSGGAPLDTDPHRLDPSMWEQCQCTVL